MVKQAKLFPHYTKLFHLSISSKMYAYRFIITFYISYVVYNVVGDHDGTGEFLTNEHFTKSSLLYIKIRNLPFGKKAFCI